MINIHGRGSSSLSSRGEPGDDLGIFRGLPGGSGVDFQDGLSAEEPTRETLMSTAIADPR